MSNCGISDGQTAMRGCSLPTLGLYSAATGTLMTGKTNLCLRLERFILYVTYKCEVFIQLVVVFYVYVVKQSTSVFHSIIMSVGKWVATFVSIAEDG